MPSVWLWLKRRSCFIVCFSSSLRSRVNKTGSRSSGEATTKPRPSVMGLFDGGSSSSSISRQQTESPGSSKNVVEGRNVEYLIAENERLKEDLDEAMLALRRITDHHKATMETMPNVDGLVREIENQQRINKEVSDENMRLKAKVNHLLGKITEAAEIEADEENDHLLDILIKENKQLISLLEKNE